ncbi:type II toxin-antitoxin system VapC family toxin [Chloroflexota bacterium]
MTIPLVIDASVSFRLTLPGAQQKLYQSLADQWLDDGYLLCAPMLWVYEMTSALCKIVRLGELTPEEGQRTLASVRSLEIQLFAPDDEQIRLAFEWTARLKRAAAYDSFYLALAEVMQCDLWTADKRLCNAVDLPWVRVAG